MPELAPQNLQWPRGFQVHNSPKGPSSSCIGCWKYMLGIEDKVLATQILGPYDAQARNLKRPKPLTTPLPSGSKYKIEGI